MFYQYNTHTHTLTHTHKLTFRNFSVRWFESFRVLILIHTLGVLNIVYLSRVVCFQHWQGKSIADGCSGEFSIL